MIFENDGRNASLEIGDIKDDSGRPAFHIGWKQYRNLATALSSYLEHRFPLRDQHLERYRVRDVLQEVLAK
jgi:hypothetical protein